MNYRVLFSKLSRSVFAKNSYLVLIINLIFLGVGIFSARIMSLTDRGNAAIFVTITAIVTYVLDLGITNAIFISTAQGKIIPRFFESIYFFILFTLITSGISVSLLIFFSYEISTSIVFSIILFNASSLIFRLYGSKITGSGHLLKYNIIRLNQTIIWFLLIFFFLPKSPTSEIFIWSYVASWIFAAVSMWFVDQPHPFVETITLRDFCKIGISSFFTNQNAIDGLKLDQVAAAKNPTIAALAALINSVTAQAKTIPLAIFPIISQRIHADSKSNFGHYRIWLIVGPLPVIFLSPLIVLLFPILLGEQYRGHEFAVFCYLLAAALSVVRLLISEQLRSQNRNVVIILSELAGLVVFMVFFVCNYVNSIEKLAIAVLVTQMTVLFIVGTSRMDKLK